MRAPMNERKNWTRIAAYYDHLVDQYGHDPRASDAAKQESLDVRYRALAGVADLKGKSVLDVGCAMGDFGAYLHEHHHVKSYLGVDISQRMIEEAAKLHPHLTFKNMNVLDMEETEQFDVVFAEGIFYLLGDDAEEKTKTLVKKMFALSKEAFACSAISSWHPHQDPSEYYVDPAAFIDFAHHLTPYVTMRHDYHHGDCTYSLYRAQR